MPVVADFNFARTAGNSDIGDGSGSSQQTVGDNLLGGRAEWTVHTGGRHTSPGFLLMQVRGLTLNQPAVVLLNGIQVGVLPPTPGGDGSFWYTHMVAFGGGLINDGNNELEIQAPPNPTSASDHFDDLNVRNIVCFFHQSV